MLDSTAPQIRVISRRRIARTRPLVIEPRDKTSGLRSARLIIGGRTVARLVKGERRIIYRPRGGWRRSVQYRYQVVAVDRAGNKKTLRRTLSIK